MTSPPVVVNGLVITGSSVADNTRPDVPSGEVRAYDARTGALRVELGPDPAGPARSGVRRVARCDGARTGAANAWSVLVADPDRDLVFVPTGSPAPDYYGALRLGDNRYANSIVALRASTGELVWAFQTVHHDLWDYDNASPPGARHDRARRRAGAGRRAGDEDRHAVRAAPRDRRTALPRRGAARYRPATSRGEEASPTQPFTAVTPPLSPHRFGARRRLGRSDGGPRRLPRDDRGAAQRGDLHAAERAGHAGAAIEHRRRALGRRRGRPAADRRGAGEPRRRDGAAHSARGVRPTQRRAPRTRTARARLRVQPDARHAVRHAPPDPAGAVGAAVHAAAVRHARGRQSLDSRRRASGTCRSARSRAGGPELASCIPPDWGSPNLGGPIATAGGVVFIGAALDRWLRAFDIETGRELWRGALPASARATPMSYRARVGRPVRRHRRRRRRRVGTGITSSRSGCRRR
jgi:quinoprotein glucose dehydrogenase